ncbi:MAG: hypothetical protein AAF614_02835 [Chloroflexota bacterium]
MSTSTDYQAFLIRLKRRNGRSHWVTTLENVHTGEVQHFCTELGMLQYLVCQLTTQSEIDLEEELLLTNDTSLANKTNTIDS